MTILSPSVNSALLMRSGAADCVVLMGLRNVNAGDTLDIGPSGANQLQVIYRCVVISVTQSAVQIAASFTGTTVTMPAGLSNDTGYLLAWGAST